LMSIPEVLKQAYLTPFTVQSNFARRNAVHIALLASTGYLTTVEGKELFGKTWRCTALALTTLKNENYL
jgi:hypothetical protein